MKWETWQMALVAFCSLIIGAILSFYFAKWFFGKQLREVEKNYQKLVRKTYQDMGNFFGRKMKEEDLNRITMQFEEENKPKKTGAKKPKPKKKK